MIQKYLSLTQEKLVEDKDTALTYGSGTLPVFATPALVGFMENCAMNCIANHLSPDEATVGIEICVKHVKATGVGKKVCCKAEVVEVEGRRIDFIINAWDEKGEIGTATHSRFIINPERFMKKL